MLSAAPFLCLSLSRSHSLFFVLWRHTIHNPRISASRNDRSWHNFGPILRASQATPRGSRAADRPQRGAAVAFALTSTDEMFFVAHRVRECTLHPSFFNSGADAQVRQRLYEDMEGKVEGTEMIVQIIEIDEISEPVLVPGTGMAKYTLSYRAIVWRPFRGEVVDGMVTSVVNNGFFVDVGALSVFVSKAVRTPSMPKRRSRGR